MESDIEHITNCPLCGRIGSLKYNHLQDRLLPGNTAEWNLYQCTVCHHLWLNPRYTQQNIYRAYEGYSDHKWSVVPQPPASGPKFILKQAYFSLAYGYPTSLNPLQRALGILVWLNPSLKARFDRQIAFLPPQPNGRVLDIGSGNGWFLKNMALLGWNGEGLDVDEVSAAKVRQAGIHVQVGTLVEQNYPDNSFDAVTLSHVLEHLHAPLTDLAECYRILKPNGRLAMITPNIDSLGHLEFQHHWYALEPPRHLNLFSSHSLRQAVEGTGFQVERLFSRATDLRSVWYYSQSIAASGNYLQARPQGLLAALRAYSFALRETLQTAVKMDRGEEIVVIARK